APTLFKLFDWTNKDYALINMSFKAAYALGLLTMGGLIDRIGTKKGFTLSIAIWSVFGMLHATITKSFSVIGFTLARFGLGFGESGLFPASIKTVAEWFPKKERALATGIFNAATSVGAILAPIIVGLVVADDGKGWQIPFLITGGVSSIWLFLWFRLYKKPENHPQITKEELDYIHSDSVVENEEKIPWAAVLPKRQTWAFALTKVLDAVWWFYLFWGAKFLYDQFQVDIKGLALPFFIIYALADGGSIFGGWLSSKLISMGLSINAARKRTLLVCALIILPVVFVTKVDNQWIAVVLIGLAAAGHQAWSANVFTLASDVFPKKAVASVVGIGGMVGAVAGMLADFSLGSVLDSQGVEGYFWAFLIAGSLYLIVLGIVHLLMPDMTPLDENLKPTTHKS
ncbi:MAG: MFS transporter, partial [Bacteroidales bacterium]|nr:MFS transporter [Bacteroidales bacterium]